MLDGTPIVLIASVSPHEDLQLEKALGRTGWPLVRVLGADDAAHQLDGLERPAVLVIDAGLLEMAHDPQWRLFRSDHPELRTVVRCLVPKLSGRFGSDGDTFEVHPDDVEGMWEALGPLCTPRLSQA